MIERETSEREVAVSVVPPISGRRSELLKLDLAAHQQQIISAVEASTDRRNRASNFIRNEMYYSSEADNFQPTVENQQIPSKCTLNEAKSSRTVLAEIQPNIVNTDKQNGSIRAKLNHFRKKRNRRDIFDTEQQAKREEENEIESSSPAPLESLLMEDQEQSSVALYPVLESSLVDEFVIPNESTTPDDSNPVEPFAFESNTGIELNQQEPKPTSQAQAVQNQPRVIEIIDIPPPQERISLLSRRLSASQIMRCLVRRVKQGLKCNYELLTEDGRKLMGAYEQGGCIGCNYYLSLDKCDRKSDEFLGKLRSGFSSTNYVLYSKGDKPKKSVNADSRLTLASVEFEPNFMGFNGPRKLKVRLPNITADQELFRLAEQETLATLEARSPGSTLVLRNRQPKWNSRINSYALDFGGRVKMASIKNFILDFEDGSKTNLMIFGKISENTFGLEFSHPFSPLQAFAVGLTGFNFKLSCQ